MAQQPNTERSSAEYSSNESLKLSRRMELAGFKSYNAHIQSAFATVFQELGTFLLRESFSVYVFGSFSDGWGSSLKKLDGRVDVESDVDLTLISKRNALHLCGRADCRFNQERRALYDDGHVQFSSGVNAPNYSNKNSKMLPDYDIIVALPCCSYPRIDLLQRGYRSRRGQPSQMPPCIMQQLAEEVLGDSPRCHAVAASPPGQKPGSCMRVSTTLLERAVMQSLTTVQGQFFILIKFLIKKLISIEMKVSGLKTYMAKNLLFYMLDETPAADWEPKNLLELVRHSLQLLVEMMLNSDSEYVCMKHFFLRDANVYFKKDHNSKSVIVDSVLTVASRLENELKAFKRSLPKAKVTAVLIYPLLPVMFAAEVVTKAAGAKEQQMGAYNAFCDAHVHVALGGELDIFLDLISKVPDCARVSRECLKVMAYLQAGVPLDDIPEQLQYSISRGIACPAEGSQTISLGEARALAWKLFQDADFTQLTLANDCIVSCSLEDSLSGLILLLRPHTDRPNLTNLLKAFAQIPEIFVRMLQPWGTDEAYVKQAGIEFVQHFLQVMGIPTSLVESFCNLPVDSSPAELVDQLNDELLD